MSTACRLRSSPRIRQMDIYPIPHSEPSGERQRLWAAGGGSPGAHQLSPKDIPTLASPGTATGVAESKLQDQVQLDSSLTVPLEVRLLKVSVPFQDLILF